MAFAQLALISDNASQSRGDNLMLASLEEITHVAKSHQINIITDTNNRCA